MIERLIDSISADPNSWIAWAFLFCAWLLFSGVTLSLWLRGASGDDTEPYDTTVHPNVPLFDDAFHARRQARQGGMRRAPKRRAF